MTIVTIEEPHFDVRPRMTLHEFLSEFSEPNPVGRALRDSASYTSSSVFLGLKCIVVFDFARFPKQSDDLLLWKVACSRTEQDPLCGDTNASFSDFEHRLETQYGKPDDIDTAQGFPDYRWVLRDDSGSPIGQVRHVISERFDLEEHLEITF